MAHFIDIQETMIPKKIHYVWLGGKKLSYDAQDFINGWKRKMPDYEITC